jgi:histidinol-phosphate aminotransferase
MVSRRTLIRGLGWGAAAVALPFRVDGSADVDPDISPATVGGPGQIRLDTTRNAYGPSAKAIDAIGLSVTALSEYPDAASEELRQRIASEHRVAPDRVVLGCGSGEILRMAAGAFTGPGRTIVTASPTCDLLARYAVRAGARAISVPLTSNFAHDEAAMASLCDSATGVVYVCNPNNPTGTITRRHELDELVTSVPANVHVVVDEAYHHYLQATADTVSMIDRAAEDDRVIVVRSFSKIYALAGLRIGYAIATARTAALLKQCGLERNVNIAAAKAAVASVEDASHVPQRAACNVDDAQEFANQVNARMLRVIDSRTNFMMLDPQRQAADVIAHFKTHRIVLAQPFPRFDRHIRVSLGTRTEMREFWRVWDLMPAVGRKM